MFFFKSKQIIETPTTTKSETTSATAVPQQTPPSEDDYVIVTNKQQQQQSTDLTASKILSRNTDYPFVHGITSKVKTDAYRAYNPINDNIPLSHSRCK